ncbi:alkaline phosphatase family protein [uncultured Chloroflexus sp.]|uniref:alkaline phosphatase family protein n=1 Tax=uncultured Chloroflexus sp. TaxID=214040 RepID=UPI002627B569|nr:alkaline phosphatase family protein [uncultured Chloroflexus sp.]
MNRVLIIGLDAADLDLIEPWVAAGWLPHIGRILRQGSFAPLRSTIPVMSPPAWTSLISGLNPGKHGIFDFVRLAPGSYHLISTRRDQTTFKTMFHYASECGKFVLAINVPMTYPPAPVHGIMVSGLGAPMSGQFTHPPQLRQELLAWGYQIEPATEFAPGREQQWLVDLANVTRGQTDAMLRLMERHPWQLGMIVYRAIDEVETFFWHHMDPTHPLHNPEQAQQFGSAILKIHRLLDEEVGRLVRAAGPDTTVVLVSDHGGGPLHREVFLNVWLEQQGWLKRRSLSPQEDVLRRLAITFGISREQLSPKLKGRLWTWLRHRIPIGWQRRLAPPATQLLADAIDWSQTKAYSFGNIGQIYINLRGREPHGVVEPGAEYEALLDEITAALFQLTDDGQPVVDAVYCGKDLYTGPYAGYGPDLNVIMRGMSYVAQSWREMAGRQIFAPPGSHFTGIHRPLGMLAMCGPVIPRKGKLAEAQIIDVAPTVMQLLGIPPVAELDGRVLIEFLEPTASDYQVDISMSNAGQAEETRRPLNPTGWESDAAEREVLDRLRSLGYLD